LQYKVLHDCFQQQKQQQSDVFVQKVTYVNVFLSKNNSSDVFVQKVTYVNDICIPLISSVCNLMAAIKGRNM